jgi:hypothetical protein
MKVAWTVNDFFKTIYERCSSGFVEFRYLPSKEQIFVPLSDFKLPAFPPDQNIYYGVATRDGQGGRKDNLVQIPALWVDFDFKRNPQKFLMERLKDLPLKPSIMTKTGGGFHLYWLLQEPATKDQIPLVEIHLGRLTSFLGADPGATDASRILRPPGTLNLKYPSPYRVSIERLDPSRLCRLEDFDFLPEVKVPSVSSGNPPGWQDELLQGISEGERNVAATKLAGRWFGMGHSEKEVLDFLTHFPQ